MIARENPRIYCYKQSFTVHRCRVIITMNSQNHRFPKANAYHRATIYISYNFGVATIKPKTNNLVSNKIIYITENITIYQLTLPNVP